MAFDGSARLVWSLTASGIGTTITASGNSGNWVSYPVNARSAVDLRRVDDVWLSCCVSGTVSGTGTPTLTVSLGAYDDQGTLFPGLLTLAGVTSSAPAKVGFGGRHGGGSGAYFVAAEWGQVAWTVTGTTPSFSGTEIALLAR